MLKVIIEINGRRILEREAVNMGKPDKPTSKGMRLYRLDDGTEILHNRKRGAVRLAMKILKATPEPNENRILCYACDDPIHKDDLGGIAKVDNEDAYFHRFVNCILVLAEVTK